MSNKNITTLLSVGTNLYAGNTSSGVFLSTNNGISWTAVNNGLQDLYVDALAVIGSNLFMGCQSGVFRSTDSGTSWKPVNNGLTNYVSFLAVSGTNIFAGVGHGGGAFRSDNGGNNWAALNSGLFNNNDFRSLTLSGTSIFAGTNDGVWRFPLSELGVDESMPLQNAEPIFAHPNPTSTSETLLYSLPIESSVTLTINDALGRVVARPIVGEMESGGQHETTFDTQNLPNGLYTCHLSAGDAEMFAKMVVVR